VTIPELIEVARTEERDVGLDEVWDAFDGVSPTDSDHPLSKLLSVLDSCEGSGDDSKEDLAKSLLFADTSIPYEWLETIWSDEQ